MNSTSDPEARLERVNRFNWRAPIHLVTISTIPRRRHPATG
ncbi:MAG TPA: hypothetical protein VF129_02820 [Actinomycetota bacterium]